MPYPGKNAEGKRAVNSGTSARPKEGTNKEVAGGCWETDTCRATEE